MTFEEWWVMSIGNWSWVDGFLKTDAEDLWKAARQDLEDQLTELTERVTNDA